ncbi:hypothetical protein MTE01_33870 [Microbacterium testaceum]|uniref:Uncharacterized protein n=1 Tax=Microbacterium testaceum TaxID=2033 RepID=A0A4Y3QQH9_MICTE|nr:hypothetical protein MTE01_33870 [Microbacterium testaceum]
MPTGSAHDRFVNEIGADGAVIDQRSFPCRCMIGEDHLDENSSWGNEPDEPDNGTMPFAGDEETYDSSGRDEDYDFRP